MDIGGDGENDPSYSFNLTEDYCPLFETNPRKISEYFDQDEGKEDQAPLTKSDKLRARVLKEQMKREARIKRKQAGQEVEPETEDPDCSTDDEDLDPAIIEAIANQAPN